MDMAAPRATRGVIRDATASDGSMLVELGARLVRESEAYEGRAVDLGRLEESARLVLENGRAWVVEVSWEEGPYEHGGVGRFSRVVGMLCAYPGASLFDRVGLAAEVALYVEPGWRFGGWAVQGLVDAFEGWAREQGLRPTVGIQTGDRVSRALGRWYRRRGYRKTGEGYSL